MRVLVLCSQGVAFFLFLIYQYKPLGHNPQIYENVSSVIQANQLHLKQQQM